MRSMSAKEYYSQHPDFQTAEHWFAAHKHGIFWHVIFDGHDILDPEIMLKFGGVIDSCESSGFIDRYKRDESGRILTALRYSVPARNEWFRDSIVCERIFGTVEHKRCDEFECFHKRMNPPDLQFCSESESLGIRNKKTEFLGGA